MRFYVAGGLPERERCSKMMEALRALGHEITYDWTKFESTDEKDFTHERLQEIAREELIGAERADIFLMLPTKDGAGQYVELGTALQARRWNTTRRPKIWIVNPGVRRCIFFHLADHTFTNDAAALEAAVPR